MTKKMLIDAAHPEETRVVIVDSNRVEELDFESRNKRQLRGNVYLARVTRVEPSRHGFLAFSEIHPDYYQIPFEDRMALIEAEEAESKEEDDDEDEQAEKPKRKSAKSKSRSKSKAIEADDNEDEIEDETSGSDDDSAEEQDGQDEEDRDENVDPDEEDAADEADAEVADEQAKVASTRRKRMSRRRYKIQEVIKRGQILLIQAVKEERGNKGAAMTTYLSLAGRYCVLMPNTPRGGGISRKIANGSDRKRLKAVMSELAVPQGMGVIVRTAGAKRTKVEIKRDYDYLARLWEEIRETTLKSTAPALIHEEGNLVKRSIRDLYNKDISEVLVQGEDAYKNAKAFIKMLMPSHAKFVKQYKDDIPLFLRYGVERQIEASLDSIVQLKSGGYLVIHPTEALVSVDVNSGRSTKERNVERTALRTNLEAAEEVARQMRLRDLAGLIVIDFIDMDENRNNRAVEKKMKEAISRDRARIQASRISQFGLMEISRQRRRRSLLEGSTAHCEHCSGVGRKRTIESSALAAIRAVEEFAVRGKAKRIRLKTSPDVSLYLFNEKRDLLQHVDEQSGVFTEVIGDDSLIRPSFQIEVIEVRDDDRKDPLLEIEREFKRERQKEQQQAKRKSRKSENSESDDDADATESETREESENRDEKPKRKGRRGRRGGRSRRNRDDNRSASDDTISDEVSENNDTDAETPDASDDGKKKPKRRRGRKAAKQDTAEHGNDADNQAETETDSETSSSSEQSEGLAEKKSRSTARRKAPTRKAKSEDTAKASDDTAKANDAKSDAKVEDITPAADEADKTVTPKAKRSTARRKAPTRKVESSESETATKKPATKRKTRAKKAESDAVKSTDVDTADSKKSAKATKTKSAPARRKAPTKKAASKTEPDVETDNADKPAKPKAKAAKARTATTKTASPRKAAPKKAAPKKADTTETDKPKVEVETGTPKPKKRATRKAPARPTPKDESSNSEALKGEAVSTNQMESAPQTAQPLDTNENPKKNTKKKGLWNRLLKS